MTSLLSNPIEFFSSLLYVLPVVLISLTFHEWGHAYMAYRLGDPTAKYMGRLTLNPLKHIDPIGLLCMVFLRIGWAKPVPIDPRYFRNPRRDDFLVSIAGVTMNFILFLITSITLLSLQYFVKTPLPKFVFDTLGLFVFINAALMVFNLLPIPPLDGYHVLNDLILKRSLFASPRLMQIGMIVLLVLAWSGVLSTILSVCVENMFGGVAWLFVFIVNLISSFL